MKDDTTIYYGGRYKGDAEVTVNGHNLSPAHSLKLWNHSPTGFEWGYGGSGPAQLALAICADFLEDDQRALQIYQEFKFRIIAALPQAQDWKFNGRFIRNVIEAIEEKRQVTFSDGAMVLQLEPPNPA